LGRELAYWRQRYTDDLGGDPSAAQATVIERIAAKRLMVGALETFILSAPSTLLVKERAYLVNLYRQMADSLRSDLVTLGLERKARPVPSLTEYLATRDAEAKKDARDGCPSSKKGETLCPSSERHPSSTYLKAFSSSEEEEMPKKDASHESRGVDAEAGVSREGVRAVSPFPANSPRQVGSDASKEEEEEEDERA